jgi:YD repeat-containing protein
MKHQVIFSTIFFLLCWFTASAQQEGQALPAAKLYLPNVMPKSPEAAGIARYGNYEVNMFSGLPNISIPLYDIKVGGLTVPISISYHAGGIKVSDMASWIGLGWSLSASGSVNRRVMGRPDELSGGYLNGGPIIRDVSSFNGSVTGDLDYLANIVKGIVDVEPDIYSYNFPGGGGKFFFKKDNQAVLMPRGNVGVSRTQLTSTQNFDLTDASGNGYKFDVMEMAYAGNGISTNDAASTWWLSKMVSANKQDTISFNYSPRTGSGSTDYTLGETYFIEDDLVNAVNPPIYTFREGFYGTSISWYTTNWQLISEIRFKDGKVVFEQSTDTRQDLAPGVDAPKRLNAIKVYQLDPKINGYRHIRTIKFYHSYFTNPNDQSKRLRLDSFFVTHPGESEGLKYRFDYNTSVSLPNRDSKSKDYWGYFNNASNINRELQSLKTLIPALNIDVAGVGNYTYYKNIGSLDANGRDPSPSHMQAYMLNKISFPTGGYTTFEFETNQYLDGQNNPKFAGGLRVKKIRSFDDNASQVFMKTYKYGAGENGYGRQNFVLSDYYFKNTHYQYYWGLGGGNSETILARKRVRTFFINPTIDLEPYDGAAVVYPFVTEYLGDEISNAGVTIYEFTDRADGLNVLGPYGRSLITSYHMNRGQLAKKLVYKRESNGSLTKVQSTGNIYQAHPEQWNYMVGVVAFKNIVNENQTYSDNYCPPYTYSNAGCYDLLSNYFYNNISIRTSDDKLIATTDTVFNPQNPSKYFHTYKRISYDNTTHWQPTAERTLTNVSDTLLTTRKYVPEYSTGVYPAMTAARIFDRVVEEESILQSSTGSTPIGKTTTSYGSFTGNNYLPTTISQRKGNFTDEIKAFFSNYDARGNVLQMNKASDIYQSYIWDYQMMSPVAEVKNASQADIAFASFEAQGQGNWSYSGAPVTMGSAPTGKRVYHLPSGAITRSGLYAPTTYIVSYWNNVGSPYSIAGTVGGVRIGRTQNGWSYYEHRVQGQSSVSISGSGQVDELRLYPEKAQMTTMTYEPLIGVSSICDVNSKILYYEYDELGRLILIRDQDRNIVKKVCYNYWQQAENCNIYYNTVQSGVYTRNNCSAGSTGNSVTYTVPAGTYVSTISAADANNKAIADVTANGQSYANSVATCNAASILVRGFNAKSSTYIVKFTNNSTRTAYTFYLNPNTFNAYNLGYVPSGTYTVQFYPAGSPVTARFAINTYSQYTSNGVTFYNVPITSQSQASMY